MAFTTSTQTIEKPIAPAANTPSNSIADAIFGMALLSVYGAQMSKKTVRKLKRKFFWTSLKLKAQSLFKPRQRVSDRTLIYIIAGVAFIALLIISPIAALVLALLVLILILAGII